MEQSPSWEPSRLATSQEIPRILRNPKVHNRIHKCLSPVPNLIVPQNALWYEICKKTFSFNCSCSIYSAFPFDHTQKFLTASGDVHNWLPHRTLGHGEQETWHRQEKRVAPLIITGLIKKALSVRSSHYWRTRKLKLFKRTLTVKLFAS